MSLASRVGPFLVSFALVFAGVLVAVPSPAHAAGKVRTAYDNNDSVRDGWDIEYARVAKRKGKYVAKVRWYDGYDDPYSRLIVVRFKAGKVRYAAQMEWGGASWRGGVYKVGNEHPVCTPTARWSGQRRAVTMRFRAACVKRRSLRWVQGSSIVFTDVGNMTDQTVLSKQR